MTQNDTEANKIDPETGQNWAETAEIDTPIDKCPPVSEAESRRMTQNGTEIEISHLTRRQRFALRVISEASSITEATRRAKIARRTLYRWLEDPHFRDELSRIHQEAAELARQEAHGLMLQGVTVLAEAMNDSDKTIRLRAARYALAFAQQVVDAEKIRKQVQDLEDALPVWASHHSR